MPSGAAAAAKPAIFSSSPGSVFRPGRAGAVFRVPRSPVLAIVDIWRLFRVKDYPENCFGKFSGEA